MCNKQNPTWREGYHVAVTDGGCCHTTLWAT